MGKISHPRPRVEAAAIAREVGLPSRLAHAGHRRPRVDEKLRRQTHQVRLVPEEDGDDLERCLDLGLRVAGATWRLIRPRDAVPGVEEVGELHAHAVAKLSRNA